MQRRWKRLEKRLNDNLKNKKAAIKAAFLFFKKTIYTSSMSSYSSLSIPIILAIRAVGS